MQRVQYGGAADAEADHGSQRGDLQKVRTEVEDIGADRGHGADKSQYIQPQRGADRSVHIFAETNLHQKSGQSDGSDDDQGERAEKRRMARVDHHQSEREQE